MKIEVQIPTVGESVGEGDIARWFKKDGDSVRMDEALLELETDKATVEVMAPSNGYLHIVEKEGTTVNVGQVVAYIEEMSTNKSMPESKTPPKKKIPQDGKAADLSKVSMQISQDIESKTSPEPMFKKADSPLRPISSADESSTEKTAPFSSATNACDRPIRIEKMNRLRKTIAMHLVHAKQSMALLTTFNEVDMTAIVHIRHKYKDEFLKKYEIKLGFMPFFVQAVCHSLPAFPILNASVDEEGDSIIYHDYYDIGIAVATPKGLVVPPIHNAETLRFWQIEKKIVELATRAKEGILTLDELQGGTFTISNGGVFGSMLSTPIVNHPQSAILGMHTIVERPMVVDGQILARPIMYLALSYDHRIIDGAEAVQFLVRVKELLEDPLLLLLEE